MDRKKPKIAAELQGALKGTSNRDVGIVYAAIGYCQLLPAAKGRYRGVVSVQHQRLHNRG